MGGGSERSIKNFHDLRNEPRKIASYRVDGSHPRKENYHEKRRREPLYQTSGPSFGWVKASLEARDRLLDKAALGMLKSELIIFRPEEDKQLLSEYTDKFAELTDTKTKEVKGSRHEIFMSGDDTLEWYMNEVLEFLAER